MSTYVYFQNCDFTETCDVLKFMWTWQVLPPTYLSHDLTQRHLFEVGGFAAHVGSGDDDKVAALRDVAIVRHRQLSSHSLQNGVTTLLDGQSVCELWAHWQTQQKKSNNRK